MEDVQATMAALASPIRREILWLLGDRELAAGAIAAAFEVSAPTVSEHLRVLKQAGLVSVRPAGTFRYYRARREVLAQLQGLAPDTRGWRPADGLPERELASARWGWSVVASVDVAEAPADVFRAFVDPALFTRWLGVPVTIEQGRLACRMEWGTEIRGRFEHVAEPSLIAFCWDVDDDEVPVPGAELPAYLWFRPTSSGTRVEVQQLVAEAHQRDFLEGAWRLLLGRLREGLADALAPDRPARRRPPRPKLVGRQA